MIPINEAIETGSLLQVHTNNLSFRIKLTNFAKFDLSLVDASEKLTFGTDAKRTY
jgi:hypothetical protein